MFAWVRPAFRARSRSPTERPALPNRNGKPPTPIHFRCSRHGVENDPTLFALLNSYAPGFQAEGERSVIATMMEVVTYLIIIVMLVLGGVLIARRWFGMGGGPFGFGRGRHRLYEGDDQRMSFKDVAGIEEAKAELKEVVDFLQDSDKYKNLGGRIPEGGPARWSARHGKDAAGQIGRRRSRRPLLQHFRQRLCRNVCRRRRIAGPRPVS